MDVRLFVDEDEVDDEDEEVVVEVIEEEVC